MLRAVFGQAAKESGHVRRLSVVPAVKDLATSDRSSSKNSTDLRQSAYGCARLAKRLTRNSYLTHMVTSRAAIKLVVCDGG